MMNKFVEKNSILHAVVWILIYIVFVNLGSVMAEVTVDSQLPTGILLLGLSVALIFYLKKNKRFEAIEIRQATNHELRRTLFYLPLFLMTVPQFFAGVDRLLSATNIAMICIQMIGVGFVEEVLFRGFLYQGVLRKSGANRAILVSGITFGLGHILNLFRGYDIFATVMQILVAVFLGVVLALLVTVTKNLLPGILFHIAFNISGTITNQNPSLQNYLLILIVMIAITYTIYLLPLARTLNIDKTST